MRAPTAMTRRVGRSLTRIWTIWPRTFKNPPYFSRFVYYHSIIWSTYLRYDRLFVKLWLATSLYLQPSLNDHNINFFWFQVAAKVQEVSAQHDSGEMWFSTFLVCPLVIGTDPLIIPVLLLIKNQFHQNHLKSFFESLSKALKPIQTYVVLISLFSFF